MNDAEVRLQVQLDDKKASSSLDNLSKKSELLSKSFDKAGKVLTVGLTVPIAGLITSGVKYNSTVETLTTSFKVMTGSAEEAVDIVSQLKEIGAKTPYEFTGLAETVQLLMQYGQTSKQAIAVTKMVGDVSQGSAEKMNSIALAYGQMSSAGKVNLMDVKQMITAGFNPLQIISDKTGESMSSMYDRISNGTMSVQEITQAFTYATSEGGKFYGSSEEQSKTLSGRLSTLKDNFNEATGSLTKSLVPALESLVDKLTDTASWFASLDDNQKEAILTIVAVVASIGPLLLIIGSILKFINLLQVASVALNVGMLPMILTIGGIVLGIAALIAIIILVVKHFDEIKAVAGAVWEAILGFFGGIGTWFGNVFQSAVDAIKTAFSSITLFFTGIWEGIKSIFSGVADWFGNIFSKAWENVKNVFSTGGRIFDGIKEGIGNAFNAVVNTLIRGINTIISIPFRSINNVLSRLKNINILGVTPFNWISTFSIPQIPQLSVGTNMVKQEGLAYLHQGEAVVPKKYNPAIGGNIGQYATIQISMGDINMDGNKVGRAITPYITKTVKLSGGNV